MVAPHAMEPFLTLAGESSAEILYRSDTATEAEKKGLPPVFELTWNHTTLRGLRVDPTITYLQVLYPFPTHVESVAQDDEDLRRRGAGASRVPALRRQRLLLRPADRPLHQRGAPRRDREDPRGQRLPDLQPAPLHAGGRRHEATDEVQLAFKREADPKGLLNPGKMIAWENPDYDWKSDKVYLFPGLRRRRQ